MGPSYCRYDQNVIRNEGDSEGPLTMTYHTDYQWAEYDSPKPKFALTCTMYLNDDYEGGDVIFKVKNKKDKKIYKPKSGDVVVFPSGHPDLLSENGTYFHGVKEISKKDKYFIRYFYMLPGKPSEDWLYLKEKYGNNWENMYEKIIKDRLEKGYTDDNTNIRQKQF